MPGGRSGVATSGWRSARARRSSLRCPDSASWSCSTRSTRRATRTASRPATTPATSRWSGPGSRGPAWSSAAPLPRPRASPASGTGWPSPAAGAGGRPAAAPDRSPGPAARAASPRGRCGALVGGLDEAVSATLARGEQALLLLNRRGFCRLSCSARPAATVAECANCSISLTVHQAPPGLRCHYCGADHPLARSCAACGEPVQPDARPRYPAAGAADGGAISGRAAGPDGSRHHEHQVVAPPRSSMRSAGARWTSCSGPR